MSQIVWPWLALAGLGAFHGLNPAMGWLFAVGLGLQSGKRAATLAALLPIALGHAAAISVFAVLAATFALAEHVTALQWVAAVTLTGFGAYRLLYGYRHTFRAGMTATFADLLVWSFLMASAHGAGLMMLPVLLNLPLDASIIARFASYCSMTAGWSMSSLSILAAVAVHTLAMLLCTAAVAWLTFEWIGLAILRKGWINLDLLWSLALIGAGLSFIVVLSMTWLST